MFVDPTPWWNPGNEVSAELLIGLPDAYAAEVVPFVPLLVRGGATAAAEVAVEVGSTVRAGSGLRTTGGNGPVEVTAAGGGNGPPQGVRSGIEGPVFVGIS